MFQNGHVMARPIPPERHSSQSTSTYEFNEVDKFLKNSQNTNFLPKYNINNGLRYDREPRRREFVTDRIPSPDTLYDPGQSSVSNVTILFIESYFCTPLLPYFSITIS